MSDLHKKRLFILAAWVISTAICLPVLFGAPREVAGQTGGDSWRNLIYDFQTLITGGLAILAAYLTVRSALKIDKRQGERHQQIMSFTARRELRTLERALYPQLDEFAEVVQNLWSTDRDPKDQSSLTNWKWFSRLADDYVYIIRKLAEIVEREQFTDALPFFDGRLSRAYFEFISSYERNLENFRNHLNTLHDIEHGYVDSGYDLAWEESHEIITSLAIDFVTKAERLETELRRASAEYENMRGRYIHP